MVWDPSVSVVVYKALAQMVTCGIFIEAGIISHTVSFVYGFNQVDQRQSLWEEMVHMKATTPLQVTRGQ